MAHISLPTSTSTVTFFACGHYSIQSDSEPRVPVRELADVGIDLREHEIPHAGAVSRYIFKDELCPEHSIRGRLASDEVTLVAVKLSQVRNNMISTLEIICTLIVTLLDLSASDLDQTDRWVYAMACFFNEQGITNHEWLHWSWHMFAAKCTIDNTLANYGDWVATGSHYLPGIREGVAAMYNGVWVLDLFDEFYTRWSSKLPVQRYTPMQGLADLCPTMTSDGSISSTDDPTANALYAVGTGFISIMRGGGDTALTAALKGIGGTGTRLVPSSPTLEPCELRDTLLEVLCVELTKIPVPDETSLGSPEIPLSPGLSLLPSGLLDDDEDLGADDAQGDDSVEELPTVPCQYCTKGSAAFGIADRDRIGMGRVKSRYADLFLALYAGDGYRLRRGKD